MPLAPYKDYATHFKKFGFIHTHRLSLLILQTTNPLQLIAATLWAFVQIVQHPNLHQKIYLATWILLSALIYIPMPITPSHVFPILGRTFSNVWRFLSVSVRIRVFTNFTYCEVHFKKELSIASVISVSRVCRCDQVTDKVDLWTDILAPVGVLIVDKLFVKRFFKCRVFDIYFVIKT